MYAKIMWWDIHLAKLSVCNWLSYSGCNWLRLGVTWVAHYPPMVAHYPPFICRLSADGSVFTAFKVSKK